MFVFCIEIILKSKPEFSRISKIFAQIKSSVHSFSALSIFLTLLMIVNYFNAKKSITFCRHLWPHERFCVLLIRLVLLGGKLGVRP